MAGSVHLDIGLNGAFITRRWERPDNWMRLTAELGYSYHEFCSDVLDPFFSGDEAYRADTAQGVREAAEHYGINVWDIYTGVATHRFHGLSHSDPSVRQRMADWILSTMRLALAMGAKRVGGHWDAIPAEYLDDQAASDAIAARTVEQFRQLAEQAEAIGLAAIYNEQMYIPSERPWTIAEGERFLHAANLGRRGVPLYLTVDVGHQAGMHYGLTGADLDYTAWLRQLGPYCEVIHLQQTTADASHHWPFTPEYNLRGHVRMETVLEALAQGFGDAASNPLSQVVVPVKQQLLVAEIIPGSTATESSVLKGLDISRRHLRQYVPEGGLTINY
jgi:sugar phosphate isomerase/epimerase